MPKRTLRKALYERDFFIPEIFDNLPIKDDMASMEHPFYTLAMKQDMRTLRYESADGMASIEIQPSALGLPTIMDKDILLYFASVTIDAINKGETPSRYVRCSLNDILKATNRHTNSEGYKAIKKAFNRLGGAMIKTNIRRKGRRREEGFHIIESYIIREQKRLGGRRADVEVTLSEWFFEALLARQVLTISPDYFRLDSPLKRRIYEIARKHCGHQDKWSIALPSLYHKSGSRSPLRNFRSNVKAMCEAVDFPDYTISLSPDDQVTFNNRDPKAKPAKKKAKRTNGTPYPATVEKQQELLPPSPIPHGLPSSYKAEAQTKAPRYDVATLWEEFKEFNDAQGVVPDHMKAAFLGFCSRRAKLKPCP